MVQSEGTLRQDQPSGCVSCIHYRHGIICSEGQEDIDLIIPLLILPEVNDKSTDFVPSERHISAILIQMKNKNRSAPIKSTLAGMGVFAKKIFGNLPAVCILTQLSVNNTVKGTKFIPLEQSGNIIYMETRGLGSFNIPESTQKILTQLTDTNRTLVALNSSFKDFPPASMINDTCDDIFNMTRVYE